MKNILIIGGYILGLYGFIGSCYLLYRDSTYDDQGQLFVQIFVSALLLIILYFKTRINKSSVNEMEESTLDQVNAKIKALTFSLQKEVIGSTEHLRTEKEIARLKEIVKS